MRSRSCPRDSLPSTSDFAFGTVSEGTALKVQSAFERLAQPAEPPEELKELGAATATASGSEAGLVDASDELARKSAPPRRPARPLPYVPRRLQDPARDTDLKLEGQAATFSARRMPADGFAAAESHVGRKRLSRAASVTSFVSAPVVIGFLGLLLLQPPSRPRLLGPTHEGEGTAQTATASPNRAVGTGSAEVVAGRDAGATPKNDSKSAVPAAAIGSVATAVPGGLDQRTGRRLGPELREAPMKSVPTDPREFDRAELAADLPPTAAELPGTPGAPMGERKLRMVPADKPALGEAMGEAVGP